MNAISLQNLERDFLGGKKLILDDYAAILEKVAAMGFQTTEVLEACLVTGSSDEQQLADYLILDDAKRESRYKEKVFRIQMEEHRTRESLQARLRSLKVEIESEKQKHAQCEVDMKEQLSRGSGAIYQEFLRGITSGDCLSETEYFYIETHRRENNISDATHKETLRALGYNMKQFEELRKKEESMKRNPNCSVCKEKRKDHVVFDCMHLCLCGDCASLLLKRRKKHKVCPLCKNRVTRIEKIFTS